MSRSRKFFRSYDIVRDAQGMPTQMLWNGDFRRVQPAPPLVCQRCGSTRLCSLGRCFDCWWQMPSEERWERI